MIPANGQLAKFLNEPPFNGRSSFSGTFTFMSSLPVTVAAVRGLTNERSEFLMTALPMANLGAPTTGGIPVFPHVANGGGWTTEIVLVNPTDSALTGIIESSRPGVLQNNRPDNALIYSIPPRGSLKIQTYGGGASIQTSSIYLTSTGAVPFGMAILSLRNAGTTVTQAGIPAAAAGAAFQLYAETSGDFNGGGSIQTGIAIASGLATPPPGVLTGFPVTIDLSNLDGSPTGPALCRSHLPNAPSSS